MQWMRSPLLTIAVLPLAACLTWTRIPVHRIVDEVGKGDEVRVATHGGREQRFEVKGVTPTAVFGEGAWVYVDQIEWLERRKASALGKIGDGAVKVLAAAAVVLAGVAIVAAPPRERAELLLGIASSAGSGG